MKKLLALMVTFFISCPGLSLAGEGRSKGESANEAAATLKDSKSNSSERSMKAEDPGKKDAARDEGVPANNPRKKTAHDTSKSAIQNIK